MGAHCAPYGRKIRRSPLSQRSHVGNLRQTIQGERVIHKRVETAGVHLLWRPRGVSALAARGELPRSAERNSSLDFKRKTLRPLGANTLTQFEYLSVCAEKESAPDRANPLTQFASPAQPVLKKEKGIPFGTP